MTRLTMPQQVTRIAPVGSLLKRAQGLKTKASRNVRERDDDYLALIRELPCLKCGMDPCGEAAHVRLSSAAHGKRNAIAAKPDDRWALSLCPDCHRNDPESQHKQGEAMFWERLGINPLLVCEALQGCDRDVVRMRAVLFTFIAGRK